MMGVVVSRGADSSYAAQVHLHALTLQGIEAPIVAALDENRIPEGVPERVGHLLRFAHQAAEHPYDPAQVEPLREAGFGDAEIAEAVAVVGLFRMVNSWTDLMAVPLDDL